eukprot:INCI9345.4.p1 GENE.INCI9345.4~~INCI9345.4.p1  ORF type:complete len:690 (+),score=145.35 INCI9345.4:610-2679(+)
MVLLKKLDFDSVEVGQRLDVVDNEVIQTVPIHGVWTEAVVVDRTEDTCQIHYICWDSSFDEVIHRRDFTYRVRPYGSKTFVEGGMIRIHSRLDVLDTHPSRNKWCTGFVVGAREREVLIHFKGYAKHFDQWIRRYSNRLAPYGRKQFPNHPDLRGLQQRHDARSISIPTWGPSAARRRNHSASSASPVPRGRSVQASDPATEGDNSDSDAGEDTSATEARLQQVYTASLHKNFGLVRKPQAPDGNCLFRSISDQVYGDPKYHTIVREYTVDYMQMQRNSFQPFVAQSMRDFEVYLRLMRCNGTNFKAVWGGEPELQAMSELYQRPIIVFSARQPPKRGDGGSNGGAGGNAVAGEAYVHAEYGAGFKGNPNVEPIRLNFYQYGHYDSAVSAKPAAPGDPKQYPKPGQIELALLNLLRAATESSGRDADHSSAASSSDGSDTSKSTGGPITEKGPSSASSPETRQLLAAIAESRQLWHAQSAKTMEQALKQSVEVEDQRALQMAMQVSSQHDVSSSSSAGGSVSSSGGSRSLSTTESKEDTAEIDIVKAVVQQSLDDQKIQEERALQAALHLSRKRPEPDASVGGGGGAHSAAVDSATSKKLVPNADARTDETTLKSVMAASAQADAESALLQSTLEASARDSKIEQLLAIMPGGGGGGASAPEYLRHQAQFLLEAANWDVEVAVGNMFTT